MKVAVQSQGCLRTEQYIHRVTKEAHEAGSGAHDGWLDWGTTIFQFVFFFSFFLACHLNVACIA